MTIHITINTMRFVFCFVFLFSFVALICGSLPDHKVGGCFWDKSRYVLWPLLAAIVMFFFVRGLM